MASTLPAPRRKGSKFGIIETNVLIGLHEEAMTISMAPGDFPEEWRFSRKCWREQVCGSSIMCVSAFAVQYIWTRILLAGWSVFGDRSIVPSDLKDRWRTVTQLKTVDHTAKAAPHYFMTLSDGSSREVFQAQPRAAEQSLGTLVGAAAGAFSHRHGKPRGHSAASPSDSACTPESEEAAFQSDLDGFVGSGSAGPSSAGSKRSRQHDEAE